MLDYYHLDASLRKKAERVASYLRKGSRCYMKSFSNRIKNLIIGNSLVHLTSGYLSNVRFIFLPPNITFVS